MLEYFKKNNLVDYPVDVPKDWEEAIAISCQKLIEQEYVSVNYVDDIIQSIIEFGPYIVIIPNVAMPHAQGSRTSVLKSGVSFTKFSEPIMFIDEKENEKKPATLFFTLAAKNPDEHLENISNLMGLFSDEEVMAALATSETIEDFERIANKGEEK